MTSARQAPPDSEHLALRETTRPVVYATQGVISSGHYLTSMAGMRLLLSGGNAFDALAASVFAAAVVEPLANYSLAAEGVIMLYDAANGEMMSLSGQGVAPEKATVDFYMHCGAVVARSPDPELLAREPKDIHMICDVGRGAPRASEAKTAC